MHASRSLLAVLITLPCALLLSCQGQSGSSSTNLNPAGFWGGCQRPDDSAIAAGFYDGDHHRMNVNIVIVGDPADGQLTIDIRHPQVGFPAATRKGCPARDLVFNGELDRDRVQGRIVGTQGFEEWEIDIVFAEDGQSATGTYEITMSDHTYFNEPRDGGPLCPNLTGTLELIRGQAIGVTQPPPFDSCPGATADVQ